MQQIIRRDLLGTQRQTLCQTVSKSWHENNCSGFLKTLSCLRYLNWTIIHFPREVKQVRAKRDSRARHTYLAGEVRLVDPLEKGDTRPRLSLRIQSSSYSSVPWTFRRFVSPANLPFGQERRVMAEFVSYPKLHVLYICPWNLHSQSRYTVEYVMEIPCCVSLYDTSSAVLSHVCQYVTNNKNWQISCILIWEPALEC